MRRLATIWLLLVFTATHTEVGQLLKLPVLVQHYWEHRQREDLSLMDFLAEHYDPSHYDEDWARDRQLPFKTLISAPELVATEPPQRPELHQLLPTPAAAFRLAARHDIPSPRLYEVFHPPRLSGVL